MQLCNSKPSYDNIDGLLVPAKQQESDTDDIQCNILLCRKLGIQIVSLSSVAYFTQMTYWMTYFTSSCVASTLLKLFRNTIFDINDYTSHSHLV